jgi:hypothetical protein
MDEERAEEEPVEPHEEKRERTRVELQHDWDGVDGIAVTVARAVAEAWTGDPGDALSLPPVGSVIDPDALERLFAPVQRGSETLPATDGGQPAVVRFGYVGYDVTVSEDGIVTVAEPEDTPHR